MKDRMAAMLEEEGLLSFIEAVRDVLSDKLDEVEANGSAHLAAYEIAYYRMQDACEESAYELEE